MEQKAQTSMEALLLLVLTLFVATVVGLYLLNLAQNNVGSGINGTANNIKNQFNNI